MVYDEYREVRFDKYCPKCKHMDIEEKNAPCCECLEEPTNLHTDKPVKYEEKEK